MAGLYDKSGKTTRLYDLASGQRVATGTASAAINALEVMLHPTVAVIVVHGTNPTSAVDNGTSLVLEAGERFHLQIAPGDKIYAAAVGTAGHLRIAPVA